MKVITIVGARPQFIKAAVVSREFAKSKEIKEIIVHTGQHFDTNMSDIFFEEMQIPKPDYNLNINGLSHGAMTGQMLEKIEEVLLKERPDWVLVYGDTNSTLAGALAAKKLHIRVVHVEAGLRSFNDKMPEEINRILTDRISNILFCPTNTALKNLKNEGYDNLNAKVVLSGDVMEDAAIFYKKLAKKPKNVDLEDDFILITLHRAENTDDEVKLREIFETLEDVAKNTQIIFPLHPRTKVKLKQYNIDLKNITVIEPVGYLEMVYLLDKTKLVITDSGGLQKEAFFFNTPCVTLRDETEWVELIENNVNILAGSNSKKIKDAIGILSQRELVFNINLYGNGLAAKNIVDTLWERTSG
ncbi:UDP-N-acetylglucosamine 2-epimerase (non-hydrolyzing) [Joostella atrarenae]|uniref:UDP-N-acetylglucosamine 2-epimerase (Non-hydrolyzing) n=1 Tax=Joostella atrarenae TaxID=679257 RepID=A0ABS9J381_9FLAO|nr:UDP-N-acetylglucosamine 2-epimerase (non-hydrolyzing) [Joostella atrarenae]MCF8714886.1 UDP-N-acetylglucosamine 2-epimerase (non-hydrolyzing) [Joostella atrarenae]